MQYITVVDKLPCNINVLLHSRRWLSETLYSMVTIGLPCFLNNPGSMRTYRTMMQLKDCLKRCVAAWSLSYCLQSLYLRFYIALYQLITVPFVVVIIGYSSVQCIHINGRILFFS